MTKICFSCYYPLHLFRVYNNNCSIDLYNRYLQTTIILFTSTCLHTRLTKFFLNCRCLLCPAFYILDECTWRIMSLPSRNLYKCKEVAWSAAVACLSAILFYSALCCYLFTSLSPFIFLYWCWCYIFVYSLTSSLFLFLELLFVIWRAFSFSQQ